MKLKNTSNNRILRILLSMLIISSTSGCKKFLEIPPPKTQLLNNSVFSNDAGAIAAQTAIYANMASYVNFAYLNYFPDLSSDELTIYSTNAKEIQFGNNAIFPDNSLVQDIWASAYKCIYQANGVLEGLSESDKISPQIKQQLIGEAEFIRAYWHFYLVNLFGDVPLVTTTSYQINGIIARTNKLEVYQQIIKDLDDAKNKLNANFTAADVITTTNTQRLRPTKWAALALLSRAYLYLGDLTHAPSDYSGAETNSSLIIANTGQFTLLLDLNNVFKVNSQEAIWQLQPPSTINNTYEGGYFIPSNFNAIPPIAALSPQLLNAFEVNDKRKANWTNNYVYNGKTYYYPFKYKVQLSVNTTASEYEVVLRFAEQYLIRAEAQAHGIGNGIAGAIADLNVIRNRAGLPSYIGPSDKTAVLNAILHERQVELFTEFGHRWLDLNRTGNVDAVMQIVTPSKGGGTWKPNQQLYPIPIKEILADPNLIQTPGY
jgi:hypothetical protein